MAVTRLKRKDRRNKARAANRVKRIKQLSRQPVIKKLDSENEVAAVQQSDAATVESKESVKVAATEGTVVAVATEEAADETSGTEEEE